MQSDRVDVIPTRLSCRHNVPMSDFVLARSLALGGQRLADAVFETAAFSPR